MYLCFVCPCRCRVGVGEAGVGWGCRSGVVGEVVGGGCCNLQLKPDNMVIPYDVLNNASFMAGEALYMQIRLAVIILSSPREIDGIEGRHFLQPHELS